MIQKIIFVTYLDNLCETTTKIHFYCVICHNSIDIYTDGRSFKGLLQLLPAISQTKNKI